MTPRQALAHAAATGRPALFSVALVALSACAGRAPPLAAPQPVLCRIDTTLGAEKHVRDRTFPPQYWYVLLTRGYQASGMISRPARDCSGLPIALDVDGCGGEPDPSVTATTALTPQDLVIANVGDAQRLVWAMTDRLSDGEAQGPVALAEVVQGGIAVRALGVLRAYPERVSLRLEHLGSGIVLVAEAERCTDPQTPEQCGRAIRILPLVGDRFVTRPVVSDSGTCVGRAVLDVREAGSRPGKKNQRYQVESVVTFGPEAVVIKEQLAISGDHAKGDPAKESFVTRVQADRQLTLSGGRLVASSPSLLSRWLGQRADGP